MILDIPDDDAEKLYMILCKAQVAFECIIPEQSCQNTIESVCGILERELMLKESD